MGSEMQLKKVLIASLLLFLPLSMGVGVKKNVPAQYHLALAVNSGACDPSALNPSPEHLFVDMTTAGLGCEAAGGADSVRILPLDRSLIIDTISLGVSAGSLTDADERCKVTLEADDDGGLSAGSGTAQTATTIWLGTLDAALNVNCLDNAGIAMDGRGDVCTITNLGITVAAGGRISVKIEEGNAADTCNDLIAITYDIFGRLQ